ncbi:MAG: ATP-binding protein [Candidatus Bipolaricaulia bacterium]
MNRSRQLRTRLIWALLGMVLLSTLALGTVAVLRLDYELFEQFKQRAQNQAQYVANEAFSQGFVQGRSDLNSLAESALGSDIAFVEIVRKGETLGRAGRYPDGPTLEVWQSVLKADMQSERIVETPTKASTPPASLGTSSYVHLGLSLDYLATERRRELFWIGGTALGIALVGLGIAWMLSWVITRPLERVSSAMERFGHGELDVRAKVERADELGTLAEEFNRMADAMATMREELKEASEAKSEFIAMMGHELRTPLGVMLGYLELLIEGVDGPLPAQQREHAEAAYRAGEHLQALLGDVLDFAKLERGVEQLNPEDIDLAPLVEDVVATFQQSAEQTGVTLDVRVPALSLRADRTKLRSMLVNLVKNAVRHSPAGGRVEIGAEPDADDTGWTLWVRDEGPGISPDMRERIFKPYERLSSATPRRSGEREGLGLGLTIARRYAELHGGQVWVGDAAPGSRFSIWLPRARRTPPPSQEGLSSTRR